MKVSKKAAKIASDVPAHKPSNRALAMLASIIGRRHGIEVVFDAGVQTAAGPPVMPSGQLVSDDIAVLRVS